MPAGAWTYEKQGAASIGTLGAEDKRQITVCLASSLHGDLLPLQLIFEGKTARSLPAATASSKASRTHLTFSANHWSSQETMQQWITEVLMPYAERSISQHRLNSNAEIILLLDVWAVHKSEQFRLFLRTHHPRVHVVFVPANGTSKLQVADVALQRPFKSHIRRSFDLWAAKQLHDQISSDSIVGLAEEFKMKNIKPLALQWCVDSWAELQLRKDVIAEGWYRSCLSLYNVQQRELRISALAEVAKNQLDAAFVPDAEEQALEPDESEAEAVESDHESNDEQDELDVAVPITQGNRRSTRVRNPPPSRGSYMISSQALAMTEDSAGEDL